MTVHRKALGKGLDALFGPVEEDRETSGENTTGRRIITVPVNDISPNREQPREMFNEAAMEELKESIRENGVLEPPIVRRTGDFFELVAGERRLRAVKELGFQTIEVILMEVESDEKMLVLSLIENIQREDLNAIEEGKAYEHIMKRMKLTQEEIASVVGKSRSAVANTIRLLNLSPGVQDMVSDGSLAPGSARALLAVENQQLQLKLARKIASENLSSRKAEELVKKKLAETATPPSTREKSPFIEDIRVDIQRVLGTEVKILGKEERGKIAIEYYSRDDLMRILETIKSHSTD